MGKCYFRPPKGVRFSPSTEFKKGQIPWNVIHRQEYLNLLKRPSAAGMKRTQFKKGHLPENTVPVDTISFREHANKKGYCFIKVAEPNKWEQYHRYLWVKKYGPIPAGHIIIFKDGDQKNCRIRNLKMITRAEHARRNANYESDKFIAACMSKVSREGIQGSVNDEDLKKILMKSPELLEAKRKQLKLRRAINARG